MNIELAREQMIEQQVRAWDVVDHEVLQVLGDIPREQFVPRDYASLAFSDTEIPIGDGQTMMTPTVEGRILQALELTIGDKVLEIGTGTGFLTACLATLAGHVTSLEIIERLLKRAGENLADAAIDNVDLIGLDATAELPDGHYDVVVVGGSIHQFDTRYVDKLADGGRLFVVVGNPPIMDARLVRRVSETDWVSESVFETSLTPLINGGPPPKFSF